MNAQQQFEDWFVIPIKQMRKASEGKSFLIELLTACVLYERLIVARNRSPSSKSLIEQLQQDFQLTEEVANVFWSVIRNGLAHQGMPLQFKRNKKLPKWAMYDSYPDRTAIRLEKKNGKETLVIQPQVFVDRVFQLWEEEPEFLAKNKAFPWPVHD